MTGEQLRRLRSQMGLSGRQMLELINESLSESLGGKTWRASSYSRWENGENIPEPVDRFLETLALESSPLANLDDLLPDDDTGQSPGDELGSPPPAQTPRSLAPSGSYTQICTDLWGIVGLGVTTVGAGIQSRAVENDGYIIDADKQKLGEAWGKLAEQNDVLKRWLMQAALGGAWLEVVLATGGTLMRCAQNHQQVRLAEQQQAEQEQTLREVTRDGAAAA